MCGMMILSFHFFCMLLLYTQNGLFPALVIRLDLLLKLAAKLAGAGDNLNVSLNIRVAVALNLARGFPNMTCGPATLFPLFFTGSTQFFRLFFQLQFLRALSVTPPLYPGKHIRYPFRMAFLLLLVFSSYGDIFRMIPQCAIKHMFTRFQLQL
jgi:hypothetical protein